MSAPRTAFAIFCDDVRTEVGNKLSLMGVYSTDIVFPPGAPPGPLAVPKFCVCWWLVCDIDDRPEFITMRLFMPDRAEAAKVEITRETLANFPLARAFEDATKATFAAQMAIINLIIPREGIIEASVETETGTIRAGRIKVRIPDRLPIVGAEFPTNSTASPQPSEQSPPDAPASKPSRVRRRASTRPTSGTRARE